MNKYSKLLFLAVITVLGICGFYFFNRCQMPQKGIIIILNGPSASGKSSIQREFCSMSRDVWLKVGIDNFFVGLLPEKFIMGPLPEDQRPEEVVMNGIASSDEYGPLFTLVVGPAGQKVIAGMHQAIAAYAQRGNNVFVDYIAYEQRWLKELAHILRDFKVYFVGVDLPLDVLEEREKARATSPIGHARSHYKTVHAHGVYDLKVDTSKQSTV
jgi:chloramphenicol 3-O phosphotransferase